MTRNFLWTVALLACAWCAQADSLWSERSVALVGDQRAHRAGDVVTVIVVEEARVSNSAGSTLSKETETEGEIEKLEIPSTTIFPAGQTPHVKATSTRKFDGKGTFQLQGTMETRLTAVVLEVLPNGNLVIEGSRLRQSVEEKVLVRVSGIARPQDIRSDNTVLSTSLAEGRIVFDTAGPIARSSRRGFVGRMVDIIWPF